ncbi:serine hydrolase FSH [Ilyonectria robusta]|uniref:serine hydrolase FSH n=1 Tax=Ilyonectria robusta TaxID=1079257 RepID=UPI001E8DB6BA|nr:serine hydrolase FSH [Ilyonectria robusta]KAH8738437.1 serine hydrolase FSH [Ilyonectria robusta]
MRFLCLHGYATSVEVLQEQMEPITSQLPGNWEYEFLEAGMEPSELMLPTLSQVPEPNYSWYNFPYPEDVERAYERLTSFIEAEGPFDGVWGFSQGGSMAALLLLMHQAENGGTSYPFKLAIFTSAFLPHRFDSGFITWDLTEKNQPTPTYEPGVYDASRGEDVDWTRDPHTSIEYDMIKAVQDKMTFPVQFLPKYRPSGIQKKIALPSVHVRGVKDHYEFVDDSVWELFDPETSRKMTHRGGHHFPRFSEELVDFAELIIETVCTLN